MNQTLVLVGMAAAATLLNVAIFYRWPWFAVLSGILFAIVIAKAPA